MVPGLEEKKRRMVEKVDIGNSLEGTKDKEWGKFLQNVNPLESFPVEDEHHPTDPNRTLVRDTQ